MRILHVLHDFLPQHVAGVEVYTDHLSRSMAGDHEVALVYSEAVPETPNYSLRRGRHGEVRTYEIVNNHRFRRFEETYRNPAVDQKLREVLDEFRPDIVHVQHLLNLSTGLIPEVQRRGIPVVMTLHDHWLACANGGQRFHAELGRCESLEPDRCGHCTSRMNGLGARGKLSRRAAATPAENVLALAELKPYDIETPSSDFVYLDSHSYGAPAWVAHPPARLRFRVVVEDGGRFTAEIAMHPDTFEEEGGAVCFSVLVNGNAVFEHVLDPKRRPEDRGRVSLDAALTAGKHAIELRTEAMPSERNEYCTAAWIQPRVVSHDVPPRAVGSAFERTVRRLERRVVRLQASAHSRSIRDRWATMRRLGRGIDLFLAPSRYLGEELVRFGLPADRVVHCDYGFPVEEFGRRELPEHSRRFAFLGSLVRHKGAHVLLESFAGMPAEAVLEVCGTAYDPSYAEELRRLARHPGVHLRGGIAPAQVPAFLRQVDCLVVPSIWQENSPLTIHEAFLAGVPVVASRMGGHVELLSGGGGVLYDADDPDDLRLQLRRLYDEPGLARRLAASAPPVKAMRDHALELLSFYRDLVERKGRMGVPA
jgi:glycosyltransferase involved in cell wall biosynthesis